MSGDKYKRPSSHEGGICPQTGRHYNTFTRPYEGEKGAHIIADKIVCDQCLNTIRIEKRDSAVA